MPNKRAEKDKKATRYRKGVKIVCDCGVRIFIPFLPTERTVRCPICGRHLNG